VSARAPATHQSVEAGAGVAIEADVRGRWDALALFEALAPFHSFLVQHADRWVVHARAPGCHGEPVDDALAAIDRLRAERTMAAPVRIDGRPRDAPPRRAVNASSRAERQP
jgi:hypothetical protein